MTVQGVQSQRGWTEWGMLRLHIQHARTSSGPFGSTHHPPPHVQDTGRCRGCSVDKAAEAHRNLNISSNGWDKMTWDMRQTTANGLQLTIHISQLGIFQKKRWPPMVADGASLAPPCGSLIAPCCRAPVAPLSPRCPCGSSRHHIPAPVAGNRPIPPPQKKTVLVGLYLGHIVFTLARTNCLWAR